MNFEAEIERDVSADAAHSVVDDDEFQTSGTGFKLRPYQGQCVTKVLRSWDEAQKNGYRKEDAHILASLPTGAGKTVIMSEVVNLAMAGRAGAQGGRLLLLVHRDELMVQAYKAISSHVEGASVGIYSANEKDLDADIVVAMVSSLARNLNDLERSMQEKGAFTFVLTDEAHHAYASQWRSIYEMVDSATEGRWLHLGVTATPMRLKSSESLSDIFPKVVFALSIFDLIAQGYLVPFKGITVETEHLESLAAIAPESDESDFDDDKIDEELAKNIPFLLTVVNSYQRFASDRKAIAFCAGRNEAEAMARLFKVNGVSAGAVHGGLSVKQRRAVLEKFARGEFQVLCNVMVLTEGFDDPSVDCVLLARPTRSLGLYIQMLGRGLRLYEGKQDCLLIDFCAISKIEALSFRKLADVLEFYGMADAARVASRRRSRKELEADLQDIPNDEVEYSEDAEDEYLEYEDPDLETTEVTPETIGLMNEVMEAMGEGEDETGDVSLFGLGLITDAIEDVASLQEFPWFIHTGIESVEFLEGYNLILLPHPIATPENIAKSLKSLRLMPYIVKHSGDDQWFAALSSQPLSRVGARAMANRFIRFFGDAEKQSPAAKWRDADVDVATLAEGYKMSSSLAARFAIPIPFRERAVSMGVAVDMINTMRSIKVILAGEECERDMGNVSRDFQNMLLDRLHVTISQDDPLNSDGVELNVAEDDKEMLRRIVGIVRKLDDPDTIQFMKSCRIEKKGRSFMFTRLASSSDKPFPRRAMRKIDYNLNRVANAVHPGIVIKVEDDQELVNRYMMAMAAKNKDEILRAYVAAMRE